MCRCMTPPNQSIYTTCTEYIAVTWNTQSPVGTHLNHARNYLKASVHSLQHGGLYTKDNLEFRWGFKTQFERIQDILSEWTLIDSAGFSLPQEITTIAEVAHVSFYTRGSRAEQVSSTVFNAWSYWCSGHSGRSGDLGNPRT